MTIALTAILLAVPIMAQAADWSWLPEVGDEYTDFKIMGMSLLDPTPEGSKEIENKYHQGALYLYKKNDVGIVDAFSFENQIYHMQYRCKFTESDNQFTPEELFAELKNRYGEPTFSDKESMTWKSEEVFFYVKFRKGRSTIQLTYQPINMKQIAKARN